MIKSSVVILLVVLGSVCAGASSRSETQPQNVVTFKSEKSGQGEAWCEMCQLIMDRVKILIKEKDSEGKVNSTLYSLCDIVKGDMRKECYDMIPLIKYQLTQGFDSRQACLMLQFCGEGQAASIVFDYMTKMNGKGIDMWKNLRPIFQGLQPHILEWFHQFGFAKTGAENPVTCMLCKTAVGLIDSTLDQYKKPLTDYVVGICNALPSPTNKACSDAMSFYIPAWWDAFFTNIASPSEVCFDLGMCTESPSSTPPRRVVKQ